MTADKADLERFAVKVHAAGEQLILIADELSRAKPHVGEECEPGCAVDAIAARLSQVVDDLEDVVTDL